MCAALAGALILPSAALAEIAGQPSALGAYVEARAAGSSGALARASAAYRLALSAAPDNELLAARALAQALEAGDRALAVTAARVLDRSGAATPDVRLLLLVEALRSGDWRQARAELTRIETDEMFSFTAPVLRAWLAVETRGGDPLSFLKPEAEISLAGAYAEEHRPLLLMASGKHKVGAEAIEARAAGAAGPRMQRLRIAGASYLARRGDRAGALGLLAGDGAAVVAARRLVKAGRPLPGEVAGARAGAAELFLQLALDLHGQQVPELALTMARLATFLAPESSVAWLVTSELLAARGMYEPALASLAAVGPADPFASAAEDSRIRLLGNVDSERALAEAAASAQARPDEIGAWIRLAELNLRFERYGPAAAALERALALDAGEAGAQPRWLMQLMRGGALVQAGDWPGGKAALEEAYRLAPDQPHVLNHLGYSLLERRENVAEARRLIEEASRLAPHDAAITDSLGWAYFLTGDLPQAIEALERAVEGDPGSATINEHLGDAYYSAGRRIEARFAWQAALVEADVEAGRRLKDKIAGGLTPQLVSP